MLTDARDAFPASAQIMELTQIKNVVQDLEARYQKVRQQYEEEIQMLRAEVQALRAASAAAAPAPSQLGLSMPPANNGAAMSGIERTGPGYQPGGEPYERDRGVDRDDRDRDVLSRRKIPKEERPPCEHYPCDR